MAPPLQMSCAACELCRHQPTLRRSFPTCSSSCQTVNWPRGCCDVPTLFLVATSTTQSLKYRWLYVTVPCICGSPSCSLSPTALFRKLFSCFMVSRMISIQIVCSPFIHIPIMIPSMKCVASVKVHIFGLRGPKLAALLFPHSLKWSVVENGSRFRSWKSFSTSIKTDVLRW